MMLPIPRELKALLLVELGNVVQTIDEMASELTVGERYSNEGQSVLDALESARKALATLEATPVIEELQ